MNASSAEKNLLIQQWFQIRSWDPEFWKRLREENEKHKQCMMINTYNVSWQLVLYEKCCFLAWWFNRLEVTLESSFFAVFLMNNRGIKKEMRAWESRRKMCAFCGECRNLQDGTQPKLSLKDIITSYELLTVIMGALGIQQRCCDPPFVETARLHCRGRLSTWAALTSICAHANPFTEHITGFNNELLSLQPVPNGSMLDF